MAEYNLAVIGGDGVGPEVIAEGRKVLEALASSGGPSFRFTEFPWGSDFYRETGRLMPEDGLAQLSGFDAILFGAVGDPNIPDHVTLQGLLLPMRRGFDQGICVRPAYLYPGVVSPLAGKQAGDIDMVIFRENTEGEYAPVGGTAQRWHTPRDRHPVQRVHPPRNRAHHPRRLRALRPPQQAQQGHVGHQVQRAVLRHGVLG